MISDEAAQRISEALDEVVQELGDDPTFFLHLDPEQFRSRFRINRRRERLLAEVERQMKLRGIEHLPRSLPTNTNELVVLFTSRSLYAQRLRTEQGPESTDHDRPQNGDPR